MRQCTSGPSYSYIHVESTINLTLGNNLPQTFSLLPRCVTFRTNYLTGNRYINESLHNMFYYVCLLVVYFALIQHPLFYD